ncbi:MAG TPA: DMT family transporter [Trueperaceae bacterium]|nr:DMT family transporter [Trueperaceae bacterium]
MPPALGAATLVGITLIWGTTFVVVKEALATIPVSLLLAVRFTMAGLLLSWARFDRRAVRPALVLGVLAFAGFATQTMGLSLTSASKAAFITGLSVILTPLAARAWPGRSVRPRVVLAAAVALAGLALMTLRGGVSGLNGGDLWVLATAVAYALYIVYLGEVAGQASATSLAALQHVPMAVLAWLWALPQVGELRHVPLATFLAILYLAAVATALVAVVQTYAQRVVPAHVAALIFVLEPVFASVFAFFLLGERLGPAGWLGGALVVAAMFVSELRPRRRPLPSGHPSASARTVLARGRDERD